MPDLMQMNPKVDFYFAKAGKWQEALEQLRQIILSCGLTEELKWGVPCYTHEGRNIVLLHHFKEYCAMLFFKGALLQDPHHLLVQQTANVQAARQIRFTITQEVEEQANALKDYVQQAIEVEKAGLKVALKKPDEFPVAEEFQQVLEAEPAIKAAFHRLTPGRQRAYLLHFAAPKQAKTRAARVAKCLPLILEGKGLNDQ